MAGTPQKSTPRLIKDYGQPRKFLHDMRARIAGRSKSKAKSAKRS